MDENTPAYPLNINQPQVLTPINPLTESKELEEERIEDKQTNKTQEEEEVEFIEKELKIKYRETPKFKAWFGYFTDKSNKETFLNQTQSAIYGYNLDPKTQYDTASVIGNKNIRKVKEMGSIAFGKLGITYGTILAGAWKKALTHKDNSLLAWVAEMSGIEFSRPIPVGINQTNPEGGVTNNTQININGVNLEQLSDEQLKQLIDNKRANLARTGSLSALGAGEENQAGTPEVLTDPPQTVPGYRQPESY